MCKSDDGLLSLSDFPGLAITPGLALIQRSRICKDVDGAVREHQPFPGIFLLNMVFCFQPSWLRRGGLSQSREVLEEQQAGRQLSIAVQAALPGAPACTNPCSTDEFLWKASFCLGSKAYLGGAMSGRAFFPPFLIYDSQTFLLPSCEPQNAQSKRTNLQSPSNLLPLGVRNPSKTQMCIFVLLWGEFFLDLQLWKLSFPYPNLIYNLLTITP